MPEEAQATPIDSTSPPELLAIDSLDQFVVVLTGWHQTKVDQVKHLLQVPEGSAFEIGGKDLVLEGKTLEGFKFGLEMALMQLGELPFLAEVEDAPVAV